MEDTDLFEKTRLDGSVSETHLKQYLEIRDKSLAVPKNKKKKTMQ